MVFLFFLKNYQFVSYGSMHSAGDLTTQVNSGTNGLTLTAIRVNNIIFAVA